MNLFQFVFSLSFYYCNFCVYFDTLSRQILPGLTKAKDFNRRADEFVDTIKQMTIISNDQDQAQ